MATKDKSKGKNSLRRFPIDIAVGQHIYRNILMYETVDRWIDEEIDGIEPLNPYDYDDVSEFDRLLNATSNQNEYQNFSIFRRDLYSLFYEFCTDVDFFKQDYIYCKTHMLEPCKNGIWELKTQDVRVFGWFSKQGEFIAASINSAFNCKNNDLYHGYMSDCLRKIERDGHNVMKERPI